jgi:DNA-binding GntR family transcriptional regulator
LDGSINGQTGTKVLGRARSTGSLTQLVYHVLRRELLQCLFEPGQPLRIGTLCGRFQVSQGAVREALSRLTSEGLVESEPQRGFSVTPVSAEDLQDLTNVRVEIEQLTLRDSIASGDARWEARVLSAFHEVSRTPYLGVQTPLRFDWRFVEVHQTFFDVLVSACRSAWLTKTRNMLQVQALRYLGRSPPPTPDERDLVAELRELMNAALERSAHRACALLAEHMLRTADSLAKFIRP